jgi:UDP-N-acetylmuramate dehydrogenase
MTFIKALRAILPNGPIMTNEPMAKYTSLKIGGPADVLLKPDSVMQLRQVYKLCKKNNWPFTLLGEGSNVLVADEGIRGVTALTANLNGITIDYKPGDKLGYITTDAGVRLARLADTACKTGLQGLAFAQGIPGSVGGAIYMNAGAYGHDIAEVCESVSVLGLDDCVKPFWGKDMGFGYRKSRVQDEGGIIIEAKFRLLPGDPDEIRAEMNELNEERRAKQPYEPSAGSTFKRPEGHFAGKLIREAGLVGHSAGGAQVSEKHAGFIINKGGATADDVCRLMDIIRKRVHETSGVWLEPEIKVLGRDYPWQE